MFNQTLLGDDDVLVQEFGTNTSVRCTIIAGIWVAFFRECQQ